MRASVLVVGCSVWSGCFSVSAPSGTSAEAELLRNVEGIRQAEIALQVVDDFLPCGDEAGALASLQPAPRAWNGPDCFARIGWAPEGTVQVAYYVSVGDGAQDFRVVGLADTDGDGQRMRVEATLSQAAKRVSADGML